MHPRWGCDRNERFNPHFSQFFCGGGSGHVYVALPRTPWSRAVSETAYPRPSALLGDETRVEIRVKQARDFKDQDAGGRWSF